MTNKKQVPIAGYLRCNGCGSSIFKIFRTSDMNEWAMCLECGEKNKVTHLELTHDEYMQRRLAKK